MAKISKKKLGTMGSKIMTEAKKLYKASGKKIKWTDCVAKAGKKLRGK
jgi:hypothetical protein